MTQALILLALLCVSSIPWSRPPLPLPLLSRVVAFCAVAVALISIDLRNNNVPTRKNITCRFLKWQFAKKKLVRRGCLMNSKLVYDMYLIWLSRSYYIIADETDNEIQVFRITFLDLRIVV